MYGNLERAGRGRSVSLCSGWSEGLPQVGGGCGGLEDYAGWAGDLVPAVSKFEAYKAIIHYGPGFLRTIESNISYTPTSAD